VLTRKRRRASPFRGDHDSGTNSAGGDSSFPGQSTQSNSPGSPDGALDAADLSDPALLNAAENSDEGSTDTSILPGSGMDALDFMETSPYRLKCIHLDLKKEWARAKSLGRLVI
jgi:hypothetical protein